VILTGTTLVTASLMYLAERHIQPDKLGTIPDAMLVGDRDARDPQGANAMGVVV